MSNSMTGWKCLALSFHKMDVLVLEFLMYHTLRTESFISIWQTPISTSHISTKDLSWIKKTNFFELVKIMYIICPTYLTCMTSLIFLFGCSRAVLRSVRNQFP